MCQILKDTYNEGRLDMAQELTQALIENNLASEEEITQIVSAVLAKDEQLKQESSNILKQNPLKPKINRFSALIPVQDCVFSQFCMQIINIGIIQMPKN